MAAAPLFAFAVEWYLASTITLVLVLIEVVALINCLTQRADAFQAVGNLSKGAWIAILFFSVLVSLACWYWGQPISIFAFAAIIAAAVYLLDVRPALREAGNGSGGW